MEKMQHTPGPWRTDKEYGNAQDEIYGPDGRAIGTVWTRRHDRSDGPLRREDYSPFSEGAANAKLIAAAPDLLDALQKLLTYANNYSDAMAAIGHGAGELGELADSMSVAGMARAAIAEATT